MQTNRIVNITGCRHLTRGWIWMKCYVSTDVETWTNWLTFEPDTDHSPDSWTGFTPDFWISSGYLKKLWTDFDEILCADSCGGLHDLVRFWARSGSESGSWIRTWTQNYKADSAKSNGQISIKFYGWITCESRKTAFNFGVIGIGAGWGHQVAYHIT